MARNRQYTAADQDEECVWSPQSLSALISCKSCYLLPMCRASRHPLPRPQAHLCTLMLAVGTNPKVVQETLGNADISVTLDIYSHLFPNMQDEVEERINELLC
jgi:hypothetical protein